MNRPKTHWYILGAGALGSLWAAYWRASGHPVTLLTPTSRESNSLSLTSKEQNFTSEVESLTFSELEQHQATINYLLVTTKAQHTIPALSAIAAHLSEDTQIVILQNGMASLAAKEIYPEKNIITAITNDGAYRTEQMSVVHAGFGTTFIDGDETLLAELPKNYLDIQLTNDIKIKQWQKLAVNCAMNGLTAIYQCRNGDLANNKEAMERIDSVCEEFQAVASALGMAEHFKDLRAIVTETIHITANNFSSMYKDIEQQRETEIDMLNGFFCQQAKQLNISCPENQRIYDDVKQREQQG